MSIKLFKSNENIVLYNGIEHYNISILIKIATFLGKDPVDITDETIRLILLKNSYIEKDIKLINTKIFEYNFNRTLGEKAEKAERKFNIKETYNCYETVLNYSKFLEKIIDYTEILDFQFDNDSTFNGLITSKAEIPILIVHNSGLFLLKIESIVDSFKYL